MDTVSIISIGYPIKNINIHILHKLLHMFGVLIGVSSCAWYMANTYVYIYVTL